MTNKILPFLVIIFFGIVFLVFYESLKDSKIYIPDVETKKEIPVFDTIEFFSEENVKSSSIFELDNIYLLNIWSSWCVPCRQEHPLLMNLNAKNKLNIIGMNYKDNLKNAKNFLNELGNPYKEIFIDLDGTIAIEWGAFGVPETYLIYKKKIIKKFVGPLNNEAINEIKLLIK
tara:strand:+ start:106 stop:624 length:519 start_codon:yes stop_codon:yes gene_type:complete